MNVLKAGGKGECYEWMLGKKERMSNVLTVGRYIYWNGKFQCQFLC